MFCNRDKFNNSPRYKIQIEFETPSVLVAWHKRKMLLIRIVSEIMNCFREFRILYNVVEFTLLITPSRWRDDTGMTKRPFKIG